MYFVYRVPYTLYLASNASTIQNEKGLLETSFHVSFAYGKEFLLLLCLMWLEVRKTMAAQSLGLGLCSHRHSPLPEEERRISTTDRNGIGRRRDRVFPIESIHFVSFDRRKWWALFVVGFDEEVISSRETLWIPQALGRIRDVDHFLSTPNHFEA